MKRITKILIVGGLLQSTGTFCCLGPDDGMPFGEIIRSALGPRGVDHAAYRPETPTTLPFQHVLKKKSSFKNAFSLNRKTLLAAATFVWCTAEAFNAKRELNREEAYQNASFFKKSRLLMQRTGANIRSRPGQCWAGVTQLAAKH